MRPARERRDHPVVADADMAGAGEAMAAAAGTVVAAAMVASEEAIRIRKSRSAENWAGLDSNQRRRKASRFTVCPVWPLRYLPVSASVDIGSRCAPRKWFGHQRLAVAVALFAAANSPNKTAVFQPEKGPSLATPKSGFAGSPTPLTFQFEQVTLPNHGAVARALLVRSVYCSGFLLCRVIRVRTTRLRQWVSEGIRPCKIVRRQADGES